MKSALFATILFLFCGTLFGTAPYPPRVFSDDRFCFVAGFPWPDQEGKVLVIRTINKTMLFGLEELGISRTIRSTAGIGWYREAIGYVGRFRMQTSGPESPTAWGFYFRDQNGHEFLIRLPSGDFLDPQRELDRASLDEMTARQAEKLIRSEDPFTRRAGAIQLGQLGALASISLLSDLLDDTSSYTQYAQGREPETVYFVREAAAEAIQLLKQKATSEQVRNEK